MKKLIAGLLLASILSITTYPVTIAWDHSKSTNVANYRIYWSTSKTGPYTNYIQVGYTTNVFINNTNFVKEKTNWFVATALYTNSISTKFRESIYTTNECVFVYLYANTLPTPVKNNHILEYIP